MLQYKNRELPFYLDLIYRPPARPPKIYNHKIQKVRQILAQKYDIELEENSPYQKGIISEAYQMPDKSYFQELKELESLVNMTRFVQKFLLKQA